MIILGVHGWQNFLYTQKNSYPFLMELNETCLCYKFSFLFEPTEITISLIIFFFSQLWPVSFPSNLTRKINPYSVRVLKSEPRPQYIDAYSNQPIRAGRPFLPLLSSAHPRVGHQPSFLDMSARRVAEVL